MWVILVSYAVKTAKWTINTTWRSYLLHNPFSKATVPLPPMLGTIIDRTSKVCKVLMRSTPNDIVVITTNNIRHSFILSRGGKEVWLPEPWDLLYSYIIDIAFLEGRLYAITRDEDLFLIHIDLDGDGRFIVARGKRIICQPTSCRGYGAWTVSEGEEDEARTSDEETAGTSDEDGDEEGEAATPENKKTASEEEGDKRKEYHSTLPDCFDYVKQDVPHGSKALIFLEKEDAPPASASGRCIRPLY
ncbi:hypothetical protein VPH35_034644 [Triticum aestivum]